MSNPYSLFFPSFITPYFMFQNAQYLLLDIGSSSLKVYQFDNRNEQKLELLETKSFHFKQNLDSNNELKAEIKDEFIEYLLEIKNKFPNFKIKTYCTAFFRKIEVNYQQNLIFEVFDKAGIFLNIVSQELENFYLQKALIGRSNSSQKILLVNIGGGSTELIIIQNQKVLQKYNLDIGISHIIEEFPLINSEFCPYESKNIIKSIKNKISNQLPISTDSELKIAIYSGGEIDYMKICDYKLAQNTVFDDSLHPYQISLEGFSKGNEKILSKLSIQTLMSKMPKDPKWMLGARSCSLIAQSIFEYLGIETIIPSNANLIDGVICCEYQSVTLSGSFRKHLDFINKVKTNLEVQNVKILSPRFAIPKNPGEEFVIFEGEENQSPLELEKHHLDSIKNCDCLVVCNENGYVGASALIEIGFANSLNKNIIFMEKPTEFMLQTLPHQIY